jgi:hypothetical protein
LYLSQVQETEQQKALADEVFMVNEVAKMTGETESTIRYRTKNKLLPITRGKN